MYTESIIHEKTQTFYQTFLFEAGLNLISKNVKCKKWKERGENTHEQVRRQRKMEMSLQQPQRS